MFGFIICLSVIGLVAGFSTRDLVPGNDSMPVVATVVPGVVGSSIGGFWGHLLADHDPNDGANHGANHGAFQASGIIGSLVGAVVALPSYRAVGSGRRRRST